MLELRDACKDEIRCVLLSPAVACVPEMILPSTVCDITPRLVHTSVCVQALLALSCTFVLMLAFAPVALQRELGLPEDPDVPLFAFIGRLDPQKGADILLEVRECSCLSLK